MSTMKKYTNIKSFICLTMILGLAACGANNNENDTENLAPETTVESVDLNTQMKVIKSADSKNEGSQQMTLTGQILFQKMEGGFYGFIANNGDKYTPSGLNNEYRKNGLIVELKVELMPDLITTTQFGKSVKVLEIKVLDSSKVSDIHKSM